MAISKSKKSKAADSSTVKKARGRKKKTTEQNIETINNNLNSDGIFGASENEETRYINYTGFLNIANDTIVIDLERLYNSHNINLSKITGNRYKYNGEESPYPSKIWFDVMISTEDSDIIKNKCIILNGKLFDSNIKSENYSNLFGDINKKEQCSKLFLTVFCSDFSWLKQYDNKISNITITVQGHISPDYALNALDIPDEPEIINTVSDFKKTSIRLNINISQNPYQYEIWENNIQPISNNRCSYALLRTNPKLTGNIKLVVDSHYNLYLDTFKVSKNLSNNKYRKVSVSTEGNYPRDIRQAFKTLPKGDLFKIPDELLNPHKVYNNLKDQNVTCYEYGCETNSDFLYPENFRMLAPLWINDILPDFFCIFKLDKFYNEETYNLNNLTYNDTEKFKEILKDCTLIKVFDLRNHTPAGIYLNNYKDKYFSPRNVFLQFSRYNHDKSQNESEIPLGKNTWTGISMDTGVISSKNEVCYYGNKIINTGTQEEFNAYIIEGYERNNMIIPNLINLEFLFDDLDSQDYIMHRYFGLYLKQNELINFTAISKTEKNGKIDLIKYDNEYNKVSDDIYDALLEQYPDRLFFGESGNKVDRLKSSNDKKLFFLKNTADQAGNNILTSDSIFRGSERAPEFITLDMKKPMECGEHIRIITQGEEFEDEKYIFEIIASNDERLIYTDGCISPYILCNQKDGKYSDNNVYIRYKEPSTSQDSFFAPIDENNGQDISAFPLSESLGFVPNGSRATNYELDPENQDTGFDLPADVRYEDYVDLKYKFNTINRFPKIFRLCFYSQSLDDKTVTAEIYEQIARIEKCIQKFNYKFYVGAKTSTSFSIISTIKNTIFQHITKEILDIDYDSDLIIYTNETELSEESIKNYNKIYNSKKTEDPTFSYFNSLKYVSEIYPLSFDSNGYTQETCMYAPFDFELLGWRKSSIVNFIPVSKYVYEIDIPDQTIDLFDHIVASKGMDNKFRHLKKFNINKNAVIYVQDEIETMNSTYLYTDSSELLYIRSPYNLNRWLVQSHDPLSVVNNHINFYMPRESSISLMGMLPVKDFDYAYTKRIIEFDNNENITANTGDILYINDFYKNNLITNQIYFLEFGELEELSIPEHGYFMLYNNPGEPGIEVIYKGEHVHLPYNYIKVKRNCRIIKTNLNNSIVSNYKETIPGLKIENYYKEQDPSKDLNWPVTLPVIFNWESINSEYLNIKNITNYSSEFINFQKFPHNIDNIIKIKSKDGSYIYDSWKNIILNHLIDNPLYTYLSTLLNSFKFKRKVIYNEYINSITFIYNQFLFQVSLSNTIYNKNINLYKYNNYDFYLIIDFIDDTASNEFYISEDENIILYIVHNYNLYPYQKSEDCGPIPETLFDSSNFEKWITWNWKKSPFDVDKNSIFGSTSKLTGSFTGYIPSDNTDASIYTEISYIDYKDPDINLYTNTSSEQFYIKYNNSVYNQEVNKFYWTQEEEYLNSMYSFLDNVAQGEYGKFNSNFNKNELVKSLLINYIQKSAPESYFELDKSDQENIKYEEFKNCCLHPESTDICILKNKNHLIYTQSEINKILDVNITYIKNEIPLKYHNEYFIPKFIDIIEFNDDETENIINSIRKSFFMGNTSVKTVNTLASSYVNTVYLEKYNKQRIPYNYTDIQNRSVLSSSWDKKFYRLINNNDISYNVDGFVPGVETKNYFGSTGIVLNNPSIELSVWPKSTISTAFSIAKYTESNKSINEYAVDTETLYDKPKTSKFLNLSVNITEALYSYFKSESLPLYTNWTNFIGTDKDNSYNNYIKTTLLKYFNITDKNNIKVYSYLYPEQVNVNDIISYTMPEDFYKYTIERNIDIEYKSIDNMLIASISIPYTQNKKYYISVNIKSV